MLCEPISFLGFSWFPGCYTKVGIHELGHILSAHHHYSQCPTTFYDPFVTFDACTVMINFVDLASFDMSVTNRLVTRGWADTAGL